jgi:hypothetical protein
MCFIVNYPVIVAVLELTGVQPIAHGAKHGDGIATLDVQRQPLFEESPSPFVPGCSDEGIEENLLY